MQKGLLLSTGFLVILLSSVLAFTIKTEFAQLYPSSFTYPIFSLNSSKWLVIDTHSLLPKCRYLKFLADSVSLPYFKDKESLWRFLREGKNTAPIAGGVPAIYFKVRCITPNNKEKIVDCAGWNFAVARFSKVGQVVRCDPGDHRSIFYYQITDMSFPYAVQHHYFRFLFFPPDAYYTVPTSLYNLYFHREPQKDIAPLTVSVDFRIKIRDRWYETQQELDEEATGAHTLNSYWTSYATAKPFVNTALHKGFIASSHLFKYSFRKPSTSYYSTFLSRRVYPRSYSMRNTFSTSYAAKPANYRRTLANAASYSYLSYYRFNRFARRYS